MKTKQKIKKDCFAYNAEIGKCMILKDLYCKYENCNFYQDRKKCKERENKEKTEQNKTEKKKPMKFAKLGFSEPVLR